MDNILAIANAYKRGQDNVYRKREEWLKQLPIVKQQLKEIAKFLNENAEYKPGYYVDTFYAYDEDIKGVCRSMPSLAFRSGPKPLFLDFSNEEEHLLRTYREMGFRLHISPIITGQLMVTLVHHRNPFIKLERAVEILAMVDDPKTITPAFIKEMVERGMREAFHSSYTGLAEEDDTPYSPIGFKTRRTETTEENAEDHKEVEDEKLPFGLAAKQQRRVAKPA